MSDIGLTGKIYWPVTGALDFFIKVGVLAWQYDLSGMAVDANFDIYNLTANEDGQDITVGIGSRPRPRVRASP